MAGLPTDWVSAHEGRRMNLNAAGAGGIDCVPGARLCMRHRGLERPLRVVMLLPAAGSRLGRQSSCSWQRATTGSKSWCSQMRGRNRCRRSPICRPTCAPCSVRTRAQACWCTRHRLPWQVPIAEISTLAPGVSTNADGRELVARRTRCGTGPGHLDGASGMVARRLPMSRRGDAGTWTRTSWIRCTPGTALLAPDAAG